MKRLLAALFLVLLSGVPAWAANYFISAAGSNSNNGTSSGTPWQTCTPVNAATFSPGDTIQFRGGDTFTSCALVLQQSGTSGNVITYTSYGTGRATISSGGSAGFVATDQEFFEISNLNFVGSGSGNPTTDGMIFTTSGSNVARKRHVYITDVTISDYGHRGIGVYCAAPGSCVRATALGYDDFKVTRATIHDVGWDGIKFYTAAVAINVLITDSHIYNIGARCGTVDIGDLVTCANGIQINNADGPILITRNLIHDLSGNYNAGIVGIFNSNMTMSHNEVYNVRAVDTDGDGLDCDWDSQTCVIEYNYAHDNDGAGILLCNCGASVRAWTGNVVRFNITANNAQKFSDYGELLMTDDGTHHLQAFDVYQNTFYGVGAGPYGVLNAKANVIAGPANFYNNIIAASGGKKLIVFASTADTNNMLFHGNAYWPYGSTFVIDFNGSTYNSIAAWRTGTGQENGPVTGITADPVFVNTSGTTAADFKLQSSSTLIAAGLDLSGTFTTGSVDFFGSPYPTVATHPNVGAAEPTPPALVCGTITLSGNVTMSGVTFVSKCQ